MKNFSNNIMWIGMVLGIFAASILLAQEAAPAADVTGTWVFQVETGAGSGTPAFTFRQQGEKLTGHYSGQLGEADLTGSVKGQAINFTFATEVQGFRVECTYSGRIENKDSMKGTVVIAGLGEGAFTGKRR